MFNSELDDTLELRQPNLCCYQFIKEIAGKEFGVEISFLFRFDYPVTMFGKHYVAPSVMDGGQLSMVEVSTLSQSKLCSSI